MARPKVIEKRRSKRLHAAWSVTVDTRSGDLIGQSKSVNISNGGLLIPLPVESLPAVGSSVKLTLSVPRFTTNTFMLEAMHTRATVLRHQPMIDDHYAGTAMRFDEPADLGLGE